MIKIGLHLSMLCKNWTDNVSMYLHPLRDAGFDGVEISLYGTTQKQLQETFTTARQLGFDLFCGTGVDKEHDPSSADIKIRENALFYLKQCIRIAHEAKAKEIHGVLYAPWQDFSKLEQKQRWNYSAAVLKEAAEYAKELDVILMVEVINRFETDFMNTLKQGSEFIQLIQHDHVKLLVDTFHMNIEEDDMCESIKAYIQDIGCIHVCENHRGVPGSGHIDWKKFIECLKEVNYDGYLIMETFTECETEVAKGMSIHRQIGRDDPLTEAIKGLQYLRKCLEEEE